MSQKTFANHLADEEAALAAQGPQAPSSSTPRAPASKAARAPSVQLKRSSTALSTPAPAEPATAAPAAVAPGITFTPPPRPPQVADGDDPLLRSYIPSAPSEAIMEALVSAPPLSYNAARAAAPASGKPQRQFCEICGYWGRIRCMKCGARVCGLGCKGTHDEEKCNRYA